MVDFAAIKPQLIDLCLDVSEFIKEQLGKVGKEDVEVKELNSLVSFVDKTAEKKLVKGLNKILPKASFITEEDTVENKSSELVWIVDPLDGTNNFLHQIPHFSISIALQDKNQAVLGVVQDIMRDDCFYASRGNGAFLNSKPINVSKVKNISDALIATGFPYNNDYNSDPYVNTLVHWLKNSRGVRRFGSAALDLAYVACGRFECYYEANLNSWDIAAGALIVQEAGGDVSDFYGGSNYNSGNQIVASNSNVHLQVLDVLKQNFGNIFHPV